MIQTSPEQKKYLRSQRREKSLVLLIRFLLLVFFLAFWELAASLGWIDSFIFSSPRRVLFTFLEMLKEQSLLSHIGVT